MGSRYSCFANPSTARSCARATSFARHSIWTCDILPKFEAVFGETHERTLNVRNNIAFDYRQLGHSSKALETDQRTFEDRRADLGAQ